MQPIYHLELSSLKVHKPSTLWFYKLTFFCFLKLLYKIFLVQSRKNKMKNENKNFYFQSRQFILVPFFSLPILNPNYKINKTLNAKSASDISPSSFFGLLCTFKKYPILIYSRWKQNKGGRVPTIKYKTQHCVRERGKLILTQSHGLTDEFMCALINWFTQRLLHVDITLVQGLKVDFYYDKLLMAEWIVTAADSDIDFCAKPK